MQRPGSDAHMWLTLVSTDGGTALEFRKSPVYATIRPIQLYLGIQTNDHHRVHRQRCPRCRRYGPCAAAVGRPPRGPRTNRHEARLRPRRGVRGMHCRARWPSRALLFDPGGEGGRPSCGNRRRPCLPHAGRINPDGGLAPAASRFHRMRRGAVWLLHTGHADGGQGVAGPAAGPHRRADHRCPRWQPLSLHRVY